MQKSMKKPDETEGFTKKEKPPKETIELFTLKVSSPLAAKGVFILLWIYVLIRQDLIYNTEAVTVITCTL